MNILVVGGGGREHALVWKLKQSPLVSKIYCAPGNAGISRIASCVPIAAEDLEGLLDFACQNQIDLTVVGPEAPLVKGITDLFTSKGLKVFGPTQKAALLEGSKVFAKQIMLKYGLPTARFEVFSDYQLALAYLKKAEVPVVVKADGLAAGKGVVVAKTFEEAQKALQEMMIDKVFGSAGERVIIEEFLTGEEVSVMIITDGDKVLRLPSSQDHKRVFDDDKGPNTGGMGAYSPAPALTPYLNQKAHKEVFLPLIKGLKQEGITYRGVIYAGLILTDQGLKVLEFNCRFGDPECQVIIPRLQNDLVPVLLATAEGKLNNLELNWSTNYTLCVVLASAGYPGKIEIGKTITGLKQAESLPGIKIFHSGTCINGQEIESSGGRVLGVVGQGKSLAEAYDIAYLGVEQISFEGRHYRLDIGKRAITNRQSSKI